MELMGRPTKFLCCPNYLSSAVVSSVTPTVTNNGCKTCSFPSNGNQTLLYMWVLIVLLIVADVGGFVLQKRLILLRYG